jgi:hypothetical protein
LATWNQPAVVSGQPLVYHISGNTSESRIKTVEAMRELQVFYTKQA